MDTQNLVAESPCKSMGFLVESVNKGEQPDIYGRNHMLPACLHQSLIIFPSQSHFFTVFNFVTFSINTVGIGVLFK